MDTLLDNQGYYRYLGQINAQKAIEQVEASELDLINMLAYFVNVDLATI